MFSTNGKQYQAETVILFQTQDFTTYFQSSSRKGPALSPTIFRGLHSDVAAVSIAGRKAVFLWMQDWLLALWSSVLNMCICAIKQCHSAKCCSRIVFKPLGPLFSERQRHSADFNSTSTVATKWNSHLPSSACFPLCFLPLGLRGQQKPSKI